MTKIHCLSKDCTHNQDFFCTAELVDMRDYEEQVTRMNSNYWVVCKTKKKKRRQPPPTPGFEEEKV